MDEVKLKGSCAYTLRLEGANLANIPFECLSINCGIGIDFSAVPKRINSLTCIQLKIHKMVKVIF